MDKSKSELPIIGKKGKSKGKKKKKEKEKEKEKGKEKTIDLGNVEKKDKNDELKRKKRENQQEYKKIENTIEESGLPMAFNVIFSELITKQILPENYFTYTSLRLKEIGKEIEGLKVKEPLYIERLNEKIPEKRLKTDGDKVVKADDIFMTVQKK